MNNKVPNSIVVPVKTDSWLTKDWLPKNSNGKTPARMANVITIAIIVFLAHLFLAFSSFSNSMF